MEYWWFINERIVTMKNTDFKAFLEDNFIIFNKNDIIDNNYYLEVSTPGIDRELKKDIDFIRFKGRSVDISLYKRIDGQKEYRGTLIEKNDEGIAVEVDGSTKVFSNNDVAKVNLAIEF